MNEDKENITGQSSELPQARALFVPNSANAEDLTVRVVFATEAPARMYIPRLDIVGYESLSIKAEHVNLDRLNQGAPLLDNHRNYGSVRDAVLGAVQSVEIEGDQLVGTVKFSQRHKDVFDDVASGILRNFSIGYISRNHEEIPGASPDGGTLYRAISWEGMELSLVPIPADKDAQAKNQNILLTNSNSNTEMEEQVTTGAPTSPVQERSEMTPPTTPAPATGGDVDVAAERAQAVTAERNRAVAIRGLAAIANVGSEVVEDLIMRGVSVEDATREITNRWTNEQTSRPQPAQGAVTGDDETSRRATAMADAIYHRATGTGQVEGLARQYANLSMVRMGEDVLRRRGVNTSGMSNREIAKAVLSTRAGGTLHTGDFPDVLGNVLNRTLRDAYQQQERTFQTFCRRGTVSDFRTNYRVQLSGLIGGLDEVKEGGEYKAGSMSDAKEALTVKKYGKIVPYTWEMMINDDLSAFQRIAPAMAAEAAQLQSDIVYDLLTGSTTMADGNPVFSAARGNEAGSGAAISETTLNAAMVAMRTQKGLNGRFINVRPAFLIVGPGRELEARKLMTSITPNSTGDVNVFANALQIIVEPRLGDAWFVAANPGANAIDTIEYAFLDQNELVTETDQRFISDGASIKVRMVFGANVIDYRGLYRNPGA